MDHPLSSSPSEFHPWRATALVAGAIAAVELVALVVAGVALLGRSLDHPAAAAAKKHPKAAVVHHAARPTPPAKPKLTRAKTTVLVLNGNGVSGAAGTASTRVHGLGYRIGDVGNASHAVSRSVIMYRPGFRPEALRLGKDLRVAMVGPLDGMRASDLHGAQLAYIVGS